MDCSKVTDADVAALQVSERDVPSDASYPTKPCPTKSECGGSTPPTKQYGTLAPPTMGMSGGNQQWQPDAQSYQDGRGDVPLAWALPPTPSAPKIPIMFDMAYGSMRSPLAIAAVYTLFAHIAVNFALFSKPPPYVIAAAILFFILPAVCTTQPFGSPFATIAATLGAGFVMYVQLPTYAEFVAVDLETGAGGTWAWRITVCVIMSSLLFIVVWVLFLCGVQGLRLIRRVVGGPVGGSNFVMQAAPWLEKGAAARRFRYTQWRLSSHRDRRFNHDGTVDTEHENTPPPDADPVQPMARMVAACMMAAVFSLIVLLILQVASLGVLHKIQGIMGHVDCPCDMPQDLRHEINTKFQAALVNITHQLATEVPGAAFLVSALPLFGALSMVLFLDLLYIGTTTIYTALEYGSFFGVVAAGALVVSSWVMLHRATLENQRKIIRNGPPAAWRTRSVNITDAEPFIGQMALAGVVQAAQGFVFGFLLIAVVRAAAAVYEVDHGIVMVVVKLASVSVGAMLVRAVLLHLIIRPLLTEKAKMKHPRVYLAASVLLLVLGLLAGIVSFLIRYLVTFVVVVWNLGRPDIVAFPSLFGRLDGIHTSYMSALIVDNEHNNPHLQSLCTALIADMHTARRARASHNELYHAELLTASLDEKTTAIRPGGDAPSLPQKPSSEQPTLAASGCDIQPATEQHPSEPAQDAADPASPHVSSTSAPLLNHSDVAAAKTTAGVDAIPADPRAGEQHLWQKEVDSFSGPTWSAVPAVRVLVEMHLRMRSGNPADPTHALQLPVAIAPVSPAQDMRRRRRAFVAARWRLAALLAANPSLRPLRKLALREAAMRAPPVLSLKDKALRLLPCFETEPTQSEYEETV